MKKVIIASQNPVKIEAVRIGFTKMFPDEIFEFQGVSVPSDIDDQPQTCADTLKGALNRAHNASGHIPKGDFWVGLEGGINCDDDDMTIFGWIVIKSSNGKITKSKTGLIPLSPQIVALVRQGMELGQADDIVFNCQNSKQREGGVGLLTDNAITRTESLTHAVILALIPFKNPELY